MLLSRACCQLLHAIPVTQSPEDSSATMLAPGPYRASRVPFASSAQAKKEDKASALSTHMVILNPKEPVHGRAGTTYTCTSIQGGH